MSNRDKGLYKPKQCKLKANEVESDKLLSGDSGKKAYKKKKKKRSRARNKAKKLVITSKKEAICPNCKTNDTVSAVFTVSICGHVLCAQCGSRCVHDAIATESIARCPLLSCRRRFHLTNSIAGNKRFQHEICRIQAQQKLMHPQKETFLVSGYARENVRSQVPDDLISFIQALFEMIYFQIQDCKSCDNRGEISINKSEPCRSCGGDGIEIDCHCRYSESYARKCTQCHGTGSYIHRATCNRCGGAYTFDMKCNACRGTGKCARCMTKRQNTQSSVAKKGKKRCASCKGSGRCAGGCHGKGIYQAQCERCDNGVFSTRYTCRKCNGSGAFPCDVCGKVRVRMCRKCNGSGRGRTCVTTTTCLYCDDQKYRCSAVY